MSSQKELEYERDRRWKHVADRKGFRCECCGEVIDREAVALGYTSRCPDCDSQMNLDRD